MVWLGPGYFMSLFTYSFSLKLLVCLFNLGIPKAVRFWNLKPHLKHRTFCKTLRCFQRCCSIFNDAIFQQCLKKLQNIVQTMHLTMSIAHPYTAQACEGISSYEISPGTFFSFLNFNLLDWFAGFLFGQACNAKDKSSPVRVAFLSNNLLLRSDKGPRP